ncbi:MAG: ATP-binding protein [Bacteroidales bacterium]|jgi:signal transduction histidine kinase|nr:ATP-binding protein [Bacteroidales bacterium]
MTKQKSNSINPTNLPSEIDSETKDNIQIDKSEISNLLSESRKENTQLSDKIENLEKAQDIIFDQFKTLELQRIELEKQQKKLEEDSDKFRGRTIDLFGKMVDLKKAKKIISLQNEKLENQQIEIETHQLLLEKSNQKFRERTIELFGKMIDLKKAKKTIIIQKEEIEIHREQLKALNASKDKFFSIIAHDLRNPIAGFLNLTEILSNNFEVFSEQESKEFIDVMNQASKQLYNLLENLLQWSKSKTNSLTHEPKSISVKKMVENTIDSLMINIESKNIRISNNVDEKLAAFVDENMITTVIRNLISNAIKFSHPKGKITLRSVQKDDLIELSVIDNGFGIKKEDQNKLFKIDQNVSTLGTSEERGTGLGLILCKEFVEKNNGTIWIESELNKGSAFIFTLPLSDKK